MSKLSARTVLQSAALFAVLVVVYAVYLRGAVASMAVQSEYTLDELMWPLLKYGVISGAPFALLALVDPGWESEHAAPVALAAWIAAFQYISRQSGGTCPKTFAFLFIPLVISALTAHTMARASGTTLSL